MLTISDLEAAVEIAVISEGRKQIMPTLVSEWIEKGRLEGYQEGIEQGVEQGTRDNILDLLKVRFPDEIIPYEKFIETNLDQVHELSELRRLLHKAVLAETLEEFRQVL